MIDWRVNRFSCSSHVLHITEEVRPTDVNMPVAKESEITREIGVLPSLIIEGQLELQSK